MTIRRGISGANVRLIQQQLADAKFLISPVDGIFGGGTESAVKQFQKQTGLPVTGVVDSTTWAKLLPGQPLPVSPLASADLISRCVALTGSFETGVQPLECFSGLSGDFDKMGMSFGALQWNIGQGTLQVLLTELFQEHPEVCQNIFQENFQTVLALGDATKEQQLSFARSIQSRFQVNEPWNGMLKTLGRTPECQAIQLRHAANLFKNAQDLCASFKLLSQRATALMFDIQVQNGGVGPIAAAQIRADFATLAPSATEVDRMRSVANRVATHCGVFADDVRTRKLAIAEGTGTVHGIFYDLDDMFSLTLDPASAVKAVTA